jgi:hypothetical protein
MQDELWVFPDGVAILPRGLSSFSKRLLATGDGLIAIPTITFIRKAFQEWSRDFRLGWWWFHGSGMNFLKLFSEARVFLEEVLELLRVLQDVERVIGFDSIFMRFWNDWWR